MNQRIRDLWEQSTGAAVPEEGFYSSASKYNIEKFAELIVKEMYVFMCDATDNDKPWPTFKEVKQHFGVEE